MIRRILHDLADEEGLIYPPYLQVVCTKLYAEVAKEKGVVHIEDLVRLGDIQNILNEYLKEKVNEFSPHQKIIREILIAFITPQETRSIDSLTPSMVKEGIQNIKLDEEFIEDALEKLHNQRILRKEYYGNETRYDLIHDCLAKTILTWLKDENIEIKKAIDFLIIGKRAGIKREKRFSHLLSVHHFNIINAQRDFIKDNLDEDDYEFMLKSSIANKIDVSYWIYLSTSRLKKVDNALKFKWIRDLMDDEESSNEVKEHGSEAFGFLQANGGIEAFLRGIIFSDNEFQIREKATISLVKVGGEKAVSDLIADFSLKDKRKRASDALSYIINRGEVLQAEKSLKEDDHKFLSECSNAFKKSSISGFDSLLIIKPLIWLLRIRKGKNKLLYTLKETIIGGLILGVFLGSSLDAIFKATSFHYFWRTLYTEAGAFSTVFLTLTLGIIGVFILAYAMTFFINMMDLISCTHKSLAKMCGALACGIFGGVVIQISVFGANTMIPVDVLKWIFLLLGAFSGLSTGVSIYMADRFFGGEKFKSNALCASLTCTLLFGAAFWIIISLSDISHKEGGGEALRCALGVAGMIAGRGLAKESSLR